MPVFRQNRLRMKLNALDIQAFMPDAHDFIQIPRIILCPGSDFKAIRQGGLFDDQGMVTGGGERISKPFKRADIVMINRRGFAMHDVFGMDNIAAKAIAYALMAEANAQDGQSSGKR